MIFITRFKNFAELSSIMDQRELVFVLFVSENSEEHQYYTRECQMNVDKRKQTTHRVINYGTTVNVE